MPIATLPLEIWLLICEFVTEHSVNPKENCNYLTFPEVLLTLHYPRENPPIDASYRNLRLVCRAFNNLFQSSPHFSLKGENEIIPSNTRALYIAQYQDGLSFLQRVSTKPSISNRIVRLDMTCRSPDNSTSPEVFDLLCRTSGLLPNVRSLRLDLGTAMEGIPLYLVWKRINDSFPLLACLALHAESGYDHDHQGVTPMVEYKNLEILYMTGFSTPSGLRFTNLKHVALNRFFGYEMMVFLKSQQLESIIHPATNANSLTLRNFPKLRLVGFSSRPNGTIDLSSRIGVRHLYLHLGPQFPEVRDLISWLRAVTSREAKLSCITLDVSSLTEEDRRRVHKIPLIANITSVDITVRPYTSGDSLIVIDIGSCTQSVLNTMRF